MKSIKTGLVVVVMLVVAYGVFKMLNEEPLRPPHGADGMMANHFGNLDFQQPGGVPQITPPNVQGPSVEGAASNGQFTGVMPQLRPAPPALTPAPGGTPSPYPGGTQAEHQGGGHAQPTPHSLANDQPGAPVVPAPSGAANVSSREGASDNVSAYSVAGNPDPPATSSVYSQPEEPASSGWGNYDSPADSQASSGFDETWVAVQDQLSRGELAEALSTLSISYGSADVPADKQTQISELLDQLAGAVIYSPSHLLEQPYEVRSGETLEDIALRYQVPWQLLANINGISDPTQVRPGMQLKVLRGPFNALISLQRQELTLFVDGRYAGRFAIALGNDPAPRTGEFNVREKETNKTFIDRDGRTIPPGDVNNPYGKYWIGLDGSLGIHGAAGSAQDGAGSSTGSIIVSPADARDLFAILSQDSRVVIRR